MSTFAYISELLESSGAKMYAPMEFVREFHRQILDYPFTHRRGVPIEMELMRKVTLHTPSGREDVTFQQLYDEYKELWLERYRPELYRRQQRKQLRLTIPAEVIDLEQDSFVKGTGFKSMKKNRILLRNAFPDEAVVVPPPTHITNSFPTMHNKRYHLHHIGAPGSYQIDIMFTGNIAYLVVIGVNTRFAAVEPLNIKLMTGSEAEFTSAKTNAKAYIDALSKITTQLHIRHLRGDNEGAFRSNAAMKYYKLHGIVFEGVISKGTSHTSLAIVDRFIRTIRDSAFLIERHAVTRSTTIIPPLMSRIVNNYNNVPHETLSSLCGFDVTPMDVVSDPELEAYVIKKTMIRNHEVANSDGYELSIGSIVKVYLPKDGLTKRRWIVRDELFVVVGRVGLRYRIRGLRSGVEIVVSRSEITIA